MINVVVASSPNCYFVGKHPFVILCSYFLANRDPAGAVCKIDQICWPPSTTQTSPQGVTTVQIKKHIQYIDVYCHYMPFWCVNIFPAQPPVFPRCAFRGFALQPWTLWNAKWIQMGSNMSVLHKGDFCKTLDMDLRIWSHHGSVSGTHVHTCKLDSVHKTSVRRRLSWRTLFEEDEAEPSLQQ